MMAPHRPALGFKLILGTLLLAALIVPLLDEPYYTKLIARMAILAIAAMTLDLLVGYAGLVSFGHAAFFGLGVYTAGLLPMLGIQQAIIIFPAAALIAGLFALISGAVSLRASGLYFIFITLAFSQMVFYVGQGLRMFGGDDGFQLKAPTLLIGNVSLGNPVVLAYTMIGALVLLTWVSHRLTRSRFGQTILAARDNESKLSALGLAPYPHRLVLYVIACSMCSVAGVGFANLMEYVSPSTMSWVVSGELLFMVILGSAATLIGPILGAVVFVGLEQVLSEWTEHWMFWLGALLVLRVLLLKDGLYGLLLGKWALRRQPSGSHQ
ncbi:MAG: branched-chain amino acid ABC transporter permease [Betaproteobacteria bacterium]|nr:branched-chain amino acid ABC transporter permease [Betaproteobacteria bacterium]